MNFTVITNNPLVQSSYPSINIIVAQSYIDVLITTRNHIHEGAKLLSHPQAGSIKPYETPYRSIVISKDSSNLSFDSLQYIENAIERFQSLSNSMGFKKHNERFLQDFQVIDADLIKSTIASLRK